ncbi:hypothetical protein AAVH_25181 [Aphelenchoides avenae]|nr:hypothetical protein AAVH_25181 [Aphelenchus avenae]
MMKHNFRRVLCAIRDDPSTAACTLANNIMPDVPPRRHLKKAGCGARKPVPFVTIIELVDSMPKRCLGVIRSNGMPTMS